MFANAVLAIVILIILVGNYEPTYCILKVIIVIGHRTQKLCVLQDNLNEAALPLFAGVPLSAPAAQEHLPSACEADHQSRRPMGESSAARNPEGGRRATKRG